MPRFQNCLQVLHGVLRARELEHDGLRNGITPHDIESEVLHIGKHVDFGLGMTEQALTSAAAEEAIAAVPFVVVTAVWTIWLRVPNEVAHARDLGAS